MKEVKPSKKPLLFYYSIVLLCVVLFNAFIAPMLMDDPVKEVDYGTFMRYGRQQGSGQGAGEY